jgi:hypothetical protein
MLRRQTGRVKYRASGTEMGTGTEKGQVDGSGTGLGGDGLKVARFFCVFLANRLHLVQRFVIGRQDIA